MSKRYAMPDGWEAPALLDEIRGFQGVVVRRHRSDLIAFSRACSDPEAAQRGALERALARVRASAFGREHALDRVRTWDEFRDAVPVRGAEAFSAWTGRVAAGETGVLTSEPVVSMTQTSGTMGAPRLLPVTRTWAGEIARAQRVWSLAMVAEQPSIGVVGARDLTSVGRRVDGWTPGGLPVGSNTGRMRHAQPWWVRVRSATPAWISELTDYELRSYVLLRLALAVDVRTWTTANPTTYLAAARLFDRHRGSLEADLVDGTLRHGPARRLDLASRRRLWPWAWRRQLPAAWTFGSFWPRLVALNCWKGGQAGLYLDRVRQHFVPEARIREVGISASEGHLAFPLHSSWDGGVAFVDGHALEFIPPGGGEPRLLHEIERGRTYRVVLTTTSGLVRYDLADLVEVVGFFGRTPCLRFVGRADDQQSMTGEKLTAAQVHAAAATVIPPAVVFYALQPVIDDRPFYRLWIEIQRPLGEEDLDRLSVDLDEALRTLNVEYDGKRATDRLGRVVAVRLPRGWADRWRTSAHLAGAAEGQLKEPTFVTQEQVDRWSRGSFGDP